MHGVRATAVVDWEGHPAPAGPFRPQTDGPVDAGDVDDDVDHVGAELVGLHVHGVGVRGHVDLAHHVEEEGFLGHVPKEGIE